MDGTSEKDSNRRHGMVPSPHKMDVILGGQLRVVSQRGAGVPMPAAFCLAEDRSGRVQPFQMPRKSS